MEGEARTFIAAPADQVWAMLADVTRMAEWSPECIRCQWLDGATRAAVGVRFRGWNRLPFVGTWTSTSTIVRCVPGAEFGLEPNRIGLTDWKLVALPLSAPLSPFPVPVRRRGQIVFLRQSVDTK